MDDQPLRARAQRVVETVGGKRRLMAAGFAAIAVLAGLRTLTPAPPPSVPVWAAAHDLSGGRPLAGSDLVRVSLPIAAVPAGALRAGTRIVGRLLAAPVRRGEALTDVRILGPSLLAALPDPNLVAIPIRVADGYAAAAVVKPGDVVNVLETVDPSAGGVRQPVTVASRVRVLAVPGPGSSSDGGGLLVLATTPGQAAALAQASATASLSVTIERP